MIDNSVRLPYYLAMDKEILLEAFHLGNLNYVSTRMKTTLPGLGSKPHLSDL